MRLGLHHLGTKTIKRTNDAVSEIAFQFIKLPLYDLKIYLLGRESYVRGFEEKYAKKLRKINPDIIF
jgi:hypothetical protein